jgi:hypothetical protein
MVLSSFEQSSAGAVHLELSFTMVNVSGSFFAHPTPSYRFDERIPASVSVEADSCFFGLTEPDRRPYLMITVTFPATQSDGLQYIKGTLSPLDDHSDFRCLPQDHVYYPNWKHDLLQAR